MKHNTYTQQIHSFFQILPAIARAIGPGTTSILGMPGHKNFVKRRIDMRRTGSGEFQFSKIILNMFMNMK
jgi:hypothetical protein